MAPPTFTRVRSGDLITAAQFNLLIDTLEDLLSRVQQIEGQSNTTGLRVDGFIPAEQQEIGGVVTILGANFVMPPRDPVSGTLRNIIRINGAALSPEDYLFTGSGTSATSLMFVVPQALAATISASGRSSVVVSVESVIENETRKASRTYNITTPTSTRPSPTITQVVGRSGGTNLRVGEEVIVRGTNFVSGSTVVELVFVADDGTTEVVYPSADHNEGAIAVTFTSPTEIRFTVPVFPSRIFIPFDGRDANLRVSVVGAPRSAVNPITILRQAQ